MIHLMIAVIAFVLGWNAAAFEEDCNKKWDIDRQQCQEEKYWRELNEKNKVKAQMQAGFKQSLGGRSSRARSRVIKSSKIVKPSKVVKRNLKDPKLPNIDTRGWNGHNSFKKGAYSTQHRSNLLANKYDNYRVQAQMILNYNKSGTGYGFNAQYDFNSKLGYQRYGNRHKKNRVREE